MLIDLHAKSSLSEDVEFSIEDILEQAQSNGLDAVAFCERTSTAYCERALQLGEQYDVDVFIGVEIPTATGLLLGFVPEIGGFYLDEHWRQLTDLTTPDAEAVIEMFDRENGVAIAARPYDRDLPFVMGDHVFELEKLTAVEVLNSRVDRTVNDFAVEAASFMGLPTVGGSDPSDSNEVVGTRATFFSDEIVTQKEFVENLRNAEYWAVEVE